jgi:hypothetical protein
MKWTSFLGWLRRSAGYIISGFVVIAGIVIVIFKKDFQIGGLLGLLTGKKKQDLRSSIASERVDESGQPIVPGQSDQHGFTQAPVSTAIKSPGLFSDPNTVVVEHPTKGTQTIQLPTGVKNRDVAEVVEIRPDVYQVKNNDKSAVDTKKLKGLLD